MYPTWKEIWRSPLDKNKRAGKQIIDRIIQLVEDGTFVEGDRLPPLYLLAEKLNTTSNTVLSAYKKLKEKHLVETKPGIGSFISGYLPLKKGNKTIIPFSVQFFPERIPKAKIKKGNIPFVILGAGIPERSRTSFNQFLIFFTKIIADVEKKGDQRLNYQTEVDKTMHLILEKRGISINMTQFTLIPNGAAIRCVIKVLINAGDTVIMDSADDLEPYECFIENQANVLFCGTDAEGLNLGRLKKICKVNQVKVVFVRPSATFPDVKFMTEQRRDRLIDLSIEYQFIIISVDDNYGWWHKQPVSPMILRKHIGNVIYIGTVSKLLNVTDKMSLVVGPESLMRDLEQQAIKCNIFHDLAVELAVSRLMQRDWITANTRKLLISYKILQKRINKLLVLHLAEYAEINVPHAGLHIYISLKHVLNINPILSELVASGLLNVGDNLRVNYLKPIKGIRIGYAIGDLEVWEKVILIFARHIKNEGQYMH